MKGPYLQVGLPFRHDSAGQDFFSGFQTECHAYTHQREAWQRLASDLKPRHLDAIVTRTLSLDELPQAFEPYVKGAVTGRAVVKIG